MVIEKNKTGFQPPGDIAFEDLNCTQSSGNLTPAQRSSNNTPRTVRDNKFGNTSTGKNKKQRGGFLGLFSNSKVRWCDL